MRSREPERWITVTRWEEFQHYKDRDPKWIKTYTRLLHDPNYSHLTQAQRGILHGLWLLYASSGEVLGETVARRVLCGSDTEARYWRAHIERLEQAEFIRISLAPRARSREKEVEKEKRSSKEVSSARAKPPGRVGENVPTPTGEAAIPIIERLIRNGVIADHVTLEAELSGAKLNSTDADKLRGLIH